MKNKFGISIPMGFDVSPAESIAEMSKAGFEASFFGWKEERNPYEYAKMFEKNHIEIDHVHAPFGNLNCMWREGSDGDAYVTRLSRCIDDVSNIHVPYVVMHPISGDSVPSSSLIGIERWRRLIDYALSRNVKICFENVEFSEMLGIVMEEFGNDVGFCYDVGHESTNDPGVRFIPLFGDRLCCTHIHDNYGLSYIVTPILHGDCHMIPLDASIDFRRVMSDIRSVNYSGVLLLEVSNHDMLGTYEKYTIREFYERAYRALTEIASY